MVFSDLFIFLAISRKKKTKHDTTITPMLAGSAYLVITKLD